VLPPLDDRALLLLLERVAARLGVEIRYERLDPALTRAGRGGGSFRIHDKTVILVDAALAPAERVAALLESLARFDLEAVYLPPALRARLHAMARKATLAPRPLARTRLRRDGD
jgi:hypothetical protein